MKLFNRNKCLYSMLLLKSLFDILKYKNFLVSYLQKHIFYNNIFKISYISVPGIHKGKLGKNTK